MSIVLYLQLKSLPQLSVHTNSLLTYFQLTINKKAKDLGQFPDLPKY